MTVIDHEEFDNHNHSTNNQTPVNNDNKDVNEKKNDSPKHRKEDDKKNSISSYYESIKNNVDTEAVSGFVKNANEKFSQVFDKSNWRDKIDKTVEEVKPTNNSIDLEDINVHPEIRKIFHQSLEEAARNIKKWFETNPEKGTQVLIFNKVRENVESDKNDTYEGKRASELIDFSEMIEKGNFDNLSEPNKESLSNNRENIENMIDTIEIPSIDELIAYYVSNEVINSDEVKESLFAARVKDSDHTRIIE